MKTILRILEPILLVLAVAWALVVVLVGGAGQGDFLTHSFALITLLVLGFLPYAIVAGILRYIRARLPIEAKDERGEKISNILATLGGIAVVLAVALSFALPVAQKDIARINTGDCQSDYYLRVSEKSGPSHGYYYENGALSFFLNGRAQATVDNPDLGTFTCYESSDTDWSRFASDKNKVYFEGETIRNAEPATFSLLTGNYSKDGDNVFYATTTLDGADPRTFNVHASTRYSMDANSVFFFGKKILGADVASFEFINNDSRPYEYRDFAKDKSRVYYQGEVVEGLNPSVLSQGGTVSGKVVANQGADDEVVLQGNYLIWRNGLLRIADPSTLEYIGLGIFRDSQKLYSMGSISKHYETGFDVADLNPAESISLLYSLDGAAEYLLNGNKVYALVSEMSLPWLELVEGADAASFKLLTNGYAKDKNSIFFDDKKLEGASVADFMTKEVLDDRLTLGFSGDKVYWRNLLLEGIDPTSLRAESGGTIIRDDDTVWFSSGNCDFGNYRKGSIDEIPNYTPPC
jgi:hypothetical protein